MEELKEKKSETELISRIYHRYVDGIYRFIYYKTYDKQTAEDLTSKTFLKAVEKIHTYDKNRGADSSWLYGIARNQVIDHFRINKQSVNIQDIWDLPGNKQIFHYPGHTDLIHHYIPRSENQRLQKFDVPIYRPYFSHL